MVLIFYEDYLNNPSMQAHLRIVTLCRPLKEIKDGKTPHCPYCGQWFPKDPMKWSWNEDLHRFEWHCISQDQEIIRGGIVVGWKMGCVNAIGEEPVIRHSGFESVDELTTDEIQRLRDMGYTDEMLGIVGGCGNGE